jgi:NADH:ubiquinone oxidoreductase subunit D
LIFLDSIDEVEGTTLYFLLEHRDYPQRILCDCSIKDENIPFSSLDRLWKNASYFERRLSKKLNKEIFVESEFFKIGHEFENESEHSGHQTFVPPCELVNGKVLFHYQVKDGVINDMHFSFGMQECYIDDIFKNRKYELYPMLIHKNVSRWKNTLTILFYKSIEDLLNVEIDSLEISYRMTLLELDRLGEVLELLNNIFEQQQLLVLKTIVKDLLKELDILLYENSDEHFGLIYPRLKVNKCSTYWLQQVDKFLQRVFIAQKKIVRSLRNNSFFLRSLSEVTLPRISYLNQLDGHLLKANGGGRDLRQHYSYYFYDQLDIDLPVGQSGNSSDFYFILQKELDSVVKCLNLLIAGTPVGRLTSGDKMPLFVSFDKYVENCSSRSGLLSYSCFDTLNGEIGIGWYKTDQSVEMRLYRPGAIKLPYIKELFVGIPTESVLTLLPYIGVNLKELEL